MSEGAVNLSKKHNKHHGHGAEKKHHAQAHDHEKSHGHSKELTHELQHPGADSSLKVLLTLSRHGSRRPNAISSTLCPNNVANAESYHVPPEQLTEVGMEQMRLAGEEIRREYIENQGFLSNSIGGPDNKHFETYFRSDAADRCAQSAIALGYGLYPDSTAPNQYFHQPISVYMNQLRNEHDFAAPKGPCKAVAKADINTYFQTRGLETIAQHKPLLEKVGQACGINVWNIPNLPDGEDLVTGIKDIADTFTFDSQQGLRRLKGVTPELQTEIEGLAFQHLMERYYSTDREVTYWVGGFPTLMLKNLQVPPPEKAENAFKYYSYHGHRELVHGLGILLGWAFDFPGQPRALDTSALDPATTMFFELHQVNTSEFIRTFVWSPRTRRTQVKLAKCSTLDCPLAEFASIIYNHTNVTGTWEQICNYHPATFAPVVATTPKPVETVKPSEPSTTTPKPVVTESEQHEASPPPVETAETPEPSVAPTTTAKPSDPVPLTETIAKPKGVHGTWTTTTSAPVAASTTKHVETTPKPIVTTETQTPKPLETTETPEPTEGVMASVTPSVILVTTAKPADPIRPTETIAKPEEIHSSWTPTTLASVATTPIVVAQPGLRLTKLKSVELPPMGIFEGIGWASYLTVVAALVFVAIKRATRRQQSGYRQLT
ncbi:hypothetical protein H310_05928 [Aphanomyces invadans]|uniref:Histidine acid phosphatase n=1 Tax=Aphanomyces invadans TaxID=157072 RepID=A0A024U851_9STRA|nr:hypothetical protein H310_05928 [Aphanomyces invadans]ETW02414.1 hypothetical protein H310_05928 [Aphanomyces invadans]|eukprot:XP_008869019.1 hypothetical protein H310_05928 [Aphanomyces invadans]